MKLNWIAVAVDTFFLVVEIALFIWAYLVARNRVPDRVVASVKATEKFLDKDIKMAGVSLGWNLMIEGAGVAARAQAAQAFAEAQARDPPDAEMQPVSEIPRRREG